MSYNNTQQESYVPLTAYSNFDEQQQQQQQQTALIYSEQAKSDETMALVLFIIGFCFGHILLWVCLFSQSY
jgi:hypothetical protein